MRRTLALVLLLLTPAVRIGAAEPPLTLTLEQALDLARKNGVDLTLARIGLQESRSRYHQAIGGAFPDVTGFADYTRNFKKPVAFFPEGKIEIGRKNSFDAGVSAEQPLYTGGKVLTGIRAARHALKAGEKTVESAEDDTVLAVKSLFFGALLSSATVGIEEDNLASAQSHLDTIRARFKQGLDSDLTLRRQEVEVANAAAVLIRVKGVHDLTLVSLQELLTLDVDRKLEVIGALAPPREEAPSYEAMAQVALLRHPGLRAAREMTQFYYRLVDIEKADMKPQLSLFGRYQWIAEADDYSPGGDRQATTLAGGVRLSYPIFTGGDRIQRIKLARLQYERMKQQELRIERAVKVEVRRQWVAIREALQRARSQEAAIEQARLALRATEIRYKAGEANQLELNDATVALNRTRIVYIRAAHDYWTSLAAMERAIGANLPEVKL